METEKRTRLTADEMDTMRRENWRKGYRTVLTCSECGESIHSRKSGQFVTCSCGLTSIDETPYYVRVIGTSDKITSKLFAELGEDK